MAEDKVIKEIKMCNSILEKLMESYYDCKKDYDFLMENESQTEEYVQAKNAVIERYKELKITIDTIKERLEKLQAK